MSETSIPPFERHPVSEAARRAAGVVMDPPITLGEAQEIVAGKTAPRVTEASIKAKIHSVEYMRHDTLTVCIITMQSGWKSIGKSAPASPENFDPAVGERYAYEDAFRPLWQLEGYLLRETLAAA